MTIDTIANKADFQRHLNGCERRLNDLTKSLQSTEKFSQKLLLNKTLEEENLYFNQLNEIIEEIKFLYSSILKLDQCSFALNSKKRLDLLKQNLEKTRNKFEQIQRYAQIKFNYNYQENQFNENEDEQLQKFIEKDYRNEQIELDLLRQNTIFVNHLEKDINIIHDAFFDLNRIIHEQGTIVNTIEQSLTNADEMIHEATENVKVTVKNKKRSARMKWFLILFFICFILILIIIIYFSIKLAFPIGK